MSDLRYWLLLQSIDGIGPVTFKNLLDKFTEPKLVFETDRKELESIPRLTQKIIEQISIAKNKLNEIDVTIEQLRNRNIKVITIFENDYPSQLITISNPPPICYLWNTLPNRKTFGIIGTRDASQFGKEKATEFAYELSKAGHIIVSGYAKGIDTAAHYGAIKSQEKTIAVLPVGILKFMLHQELSEFTDQFYNQATIISEFYPLSEWSVGNALSRNRITSALSDNILVVESGESGGTLNTVEHAKEQGKRVFLYKGIQSSTDEKIKALGVTEIATPKELLALLDT
jgi:DNA processing protein